MPRLTAAHLPAGSLNHRAQPVLRAKGYMLRPWTKADADALLAAFADPEIRLWNAQSLGSRPEAAAMIALFNKGWLGAQRRNRRRHGGATAPQLTSPCLLITVDHSRRRGGGPGIEPLERLHGDALPCS
ncbi:hypothetical protein [Streptomyces sp. NPDC056227]|uniref:hypothetical protein n=1 Tax=Streptomyces sp. NPDC056227 TaxID=3345753 RepID=UPI0035D97222